MRFSEIGHSPHVDSYIESIKQKKGATNAIPFEYVDPASAHLFILVRLEFTDRLKSFTVFRVVSDQIINHMPELDSIPLYGITEVVSHIDAPVYLVEGEKKADRLLEAGLIAVSPFGGAANIRRANLLPLAGRTVILLPDDGDAGRNWTRELGGRLNGLRCTVFVIRTDKLINDSQRKSIEDVSGKPKLDIHDIFDANSFLSGIWESTLSAIRDHYQEIGERCTVMPADEHNTKSRVTRDVLLRATLKQIDLVIERRRSDHGGYGWINNAGYTRATGDNTAPIGIIYNRIAKEMGTDFLFNEKVKSDLVTNIDAYCSDAGCEKDIIEQHFRSATFVDRIASTHAAMLNGELYYGLNNRDGDVVVVSAEGIEVKPIQDCLTEGISFTRLSESAETLNTKCEIPTSLEQAVEYVNLLWPIMNPHLSENERARLIAFMLFSMRDDMPQPILALEGEAGSGKTTAAETICLLLDPPPNRIEKIEEETESLLKCMKHRIIWYDNVYTLSEKVSDTLCSRATSAEINWRPLHTNSIKRIDGYNAIITTSTHPIWERADVADRVIVVTHKTIKNNPAFDAQFRNCWIADNRGKILGGLFYLFMQALRGFADEMAEVAGRNKPFIRFSQAAFRGTPWEDLIQEGIQESNDIVSETLTSDLTIEAIITLLKAGNGSFFYKNVAELKDALLCVLERQGTRVRKDASLVYSSPHVSSPGQVINNKYARILNMICNKPKQLLRELKAAAVGLRQLGIKYIECDYRPKTEGKRLSRLYMRGYVLPNADDSTLKERVDTCIKSQITSGMDEKIAGAFARKCYEMLGLDPDEGEQRMAAHLKPSKLSLERYSSFLKRP